MLVWEILFGEKCPNKCVNKTKRDICNKCKYKEDIYWNYVICKNI